MTTLTTLNGNTPAALAETLERLTRRFGPAAAVRPAAESSGPPAVIPTGFAALDRALGIGGLPRGRIVDVFGPEASGKTTLCLHAIAQTQRQGGQALYLDTENGFDLAYALARGIDPQRLFIAQPDTAEEALAIALALVQAGLALVVIDSLAGLTPRAEVEGDLGLDYPGLLAGQLSQFWRKVGGPLRRHKSLLLVTNQLRATPGGESSTGGVALRHYAAIRLDLRRVQTLKQGGQPVGSLIRATVRKNKLAAPFRAAEIELYHGGRP